MAGCIREVLRMLRFLKHTYLFCNMQIKWLLSFLFKRRYLDWLLLEDNFKNIPIYIISYNRLTYLRQMITWLEDCGYNNITVIDNNSTQPELLAYLSSIQHTVVRTKKNYGYRVFYLLPKFFFDRNFRFFVITDPDLKPVEGCPNDFVKQFAEIMRRHYKYSKVGFSLKIDDIPDDYILKSDVLEWESQFYINQLKDVAPFQIYDAGLDTTFSFCSPTIFVPRKASYMGIRTGYPYQLRHLPWYITRKDEENDYYCSSIRTDMTTWNGNFSSAEIKEIQKR